MSLMEEAAERDEGLEVLLAACIDAAESGDVDSVRTVLQENPDHAPALRRVLENLVDMGLVDDERQGLEAEALGSLGPYLLESELGRGGQGVVYRARDTRLDRPVALKLLSGFGPLSEESRERFQREAMVASRLNHPGVCTVYDAGAEDGRPWIAMELVEGESLAERIGRRRDASLATAAFPPGSAVAEDVVVPEALSSSTAVERSEIPEIVRLFAELARACHHAHEAGVIHRDLKPGNVMITGEGRPVILDFGLAGDETDASPVLTRTGERFGTPAYMSPEQIDRRDRPIDRRTDVWSLGVSLYEALAGQRPFTGPTRGELERAILEEPPVPLRRWVEGLPRDLAIVVERALEKHPDDRYSTAEDLAEDLRRVADHEPILARRVSVAHRFLRWIQRHPGLAASLALFVISVTAGLTASLLLLDSRTKILREYQSMSDASFVRRLLTEEPELWPATPERSASLKLWITQADDALGRRPELRRSWERLVKDAVAAERGLSEQRIREGLHPAVLPAKAEEREEKTLYYPDGDTAWRVEVLTRLLDDLDHLESRRPKMTERLALADSLERTSLQDASSAWDRCIESIEDDRRFRDFVLDPQLGLVPLGRDRDSRLWEFWHVASGLRPEWEGDEDAGRVKITADSGLVLVLVPGGRFLMGAQSQSPDQPHYDRDPMNFVDPVHPVQLDPYFLSKFEMTQAQWARVMEKNPSYHQPGGVLGGQRMTTLNPVENVSWNDCARALARLDLELPTEAWWERAARAGTSTRWFSGDEVASLQGKANVADKTAMTITTWRCENELDDGHLCHAPVNAFAPNPFGFHGMVGNVSEWCHCRPLGYISPLLDRAGRREEPPDAASAGRIYRGSAYDGTAHKGRSARRDGAPEDLVVHNLGVRPARAVRP